MSALDDYQTEEGLIRLDIDALGDLQDKLVAKRLEKEAEIDKVYTPEIRLKVKQIEARYESDTAETQEQIKALEEKVKKAVVDHGRKVAGLRLGYSYCNGKSTVTMADVDELAQELLAENMPELAKRVSDLIKKGKPYASVYNL